MNKNTVITIKLGIFAFILSYATYYLAQLTYTDQDSIGYSLGVLGAPVVGIFALGFIIAFSVYLFDSEGE